MITHYFDSERRGPFASYCADNAHIWKLYIEHGKVSDDELANILNSDLDPLLIFVSSVFTSHNDQQRMISVQAGLFSAILSAFLIQVRQGLQEDPQDTTNSLLKILIQNQHNTTGPPIPLTTPHFKPTSSSRWVNGLWFSSLIFSLMSALGASLAKGWVMQYASAGSGSNWRDACSRHCRFTGIKRWRLTVIIQCLPLLIHTAFFLFSAGLVILLREDDVGISGVILALVIVVASLYIGSTLHPVFSSDSPFRTPVSSFITWIIVRPIATPQAFPPPTSDAMKAQALAWLLTESADSKVIEVSVRAIAGLPANARVQDELYQSSVMDILSRGLSECMKRSGNPTRLSSYLYAILHLVQTGPSNLLDTSTGFALISLIKPGGPLHVLDNLERGIHEVALCVKARIILLHLDSSHSETGLFNVDIPVLLKSHLQPHIRQLLLEIHLLGNISTGVMTGSAQTETFLDMLRSSNGKIRNNGHEQLLKVANSGLYIVH